MTCHGASLGAENEQVAKDESKNEQDGQDSKKTDAVFSIGHFRTEVTQAA
jgi:hypothetical protein